MVYAVIIKKKRKIKDVVKNNKLKKKLKRILHDDEIKYLEYESVKYVSMIGFKSSSKCDVRKTIFKKDAVFYLKQDFPYIEAVMKNVEYSIIDVNTNEEVKRLPAKITVNSNIFKTINNVKRLKSTNYVY